METLLADVIGDGAVGCFRGGGPVEVAFQVRGPAAEGVEGVGSDDFVEGGPGVWFE